ncbi:autophagy-related protein 22-like protein [Globomyces pollinis-pini]|nr:autophagy-related protein 22-like protein [Globomyces pollinis-pini]
MTNSESVQNLARESVANETGVTTAVPSYDGEDTSECTALELRAFYSFGTEGYSALAIAVFFPIILQSLAAYEAVQTKDRSQPCKVEGAYSCEVLIGSTYVDTSSLVLYATSISVFLQFILFSSLGSVADYGPNRKKFLMFFGYATGILGFCLAFVVKTSMYWVAFLIYIFSNTFFGASFVFFYSWVPILSKYSSEVIESRNNPNLTDAEKYLVSDRVSNDISSKGFLYGYIAGVGQLILAAAFVVVMGDSMKGYPTVYPMQLCISAICIWHIAVLFFYTNRHLKSRPGPPLPVGKNYILFSLQNLYKSISEAKQQPELFKFLIAWFIYSDAFSTVVNIAILFAQANLGAGIVLLLSGAIIVPFGAGVGNILWIKFQNHYKFTTVQILRIQACLYLLMPLYGLIGFFAPFGLVSSVELLPLALFHGLLLGATQSSCRVLFSELLPPGHESEFFGLYEITDKGSAWVGPLLVALITQFTGNMRWSFIFIALMFLVPISIFSRIDVLKGKKEAKAYADKQKQHKL